MKTNVKQTLGLGMLLGALATGAISQGWNPVGSAHAKAAEVIVDDTPLSASARQRATYSPAIKKAAPSVVYISTSKTMKASQINGPQFDDSFLRRFFGDRLPQMPQTPEGPTRSGLGSGVIVSRDGYILTNNHVVENADEVKVRLADDKKEYTAEVVGTDPATDIAVLKIDAEDLPAITLGNSDRLEVGDVALAIGNPFGVGQTVTMGIVSATRRGDLGIVNYEDFIQTDASINPGNSGGALVDAGGRLVGINTAIISRTGGNNGVGLAVPMNLARSVMEQIISDGSVSRGYLGVMIQDVTPELADALNLDTDRGALVGEVTEDSAADKAGLKPYDLIVEVAGKKVENRRELSLLVAQQRPGQKVNLRVVRDGKEKTLRAELGKRPGDLSVASVDRGSQGSKALSGLQLKDLDRETRRRFDVPEDVDGAVVSQVVPGSAAARAGLRPGDVIHEIDRQPVKDAAEAEDRLADKDANVLRIWSRGANRIALLKPIQQG